MLCGQSEPRSFRMMTLMIIWLHLIISVILILGFALEDTNSEPLASNGMLRFYVLCFSILSIVPQLLAIYGVNKKAPLFLTPYIISLMTITSLLILVIIIIIVGMIFDPEHVLHEWGTPKTSYCETLQDLWLAILGMSLIVVILVMCLFVVLSYYKILLKQEELNQLRYIETHLPHQQEIASRIIPEPQSPVASTLPPPMLPTTSTQSPASVVESLPPKEEDEEEPPPSYSRAQSIIGQSYA